MVKKLMIAFVVVAVALAVATPAKADQLSDLLAQIATLQSQIAALQGGSTGGSTASATFTKDLGMGATGADVSALQSWLIAKGYAIPAGATGYYGAQTAAAVKAYQAAHMINATGFFGPMTRASVNSMATPATGGSTGGSTTGGSTPTTLKGGAGDITVTEKNSGTDDQVLEGDEDAKVVGMDIKATGSDVAITSVKVELTQPSSGSTRLNRYVDSVDIMMNGKVVGSADANDFTKDGSLYTKSISLDKAMIGENETQRFYVAVNAIENIDSANLGNNWTAAVTNVRFQDATEAILNESVSTVSEAFSFEDLSTAGDVTLRVSEDDADVNETHVVSVDDTSDTNDVDVLSFTLEAEGSDIAVNQLNFGVSGNGAGVTEIANDFRLLMDGQEVGTVTIDKDCDGGSDGFASSTDTAICVSVANLDDDDVVINDGDTVPFTLVADINDIDGAFSSGDDLSVTLNADVTLSSNGSIDADDQNGDALTVSDMTGSADSTTIDFQSTGIQVTTVSTNTSVNAVQSDVGTDDLGLFEVVFDVKAIEDDAFVEIGDDATRGTTESNTGANYVIQDAPNSYSATTTGSIVSARLTRVSGGTVSGNFIKVGAGQTARFKLVTTFDPGHAANTTVGYRMYLYSVNFATTATDASDQQILTPELDYRTDTLAVGN